MVAKRIFHSYQLSGFTCFAFFFFCLNSIDVWGIFIFVQYFPSRSSIKKHFIFLKDKTRDLPLQEKWKNGSRETFSVVFIDFSSDSLSFFSCLAQSICLISASLLCWCSLPKKNLLSFPMHIYVFASQGRSFLFFLLSSHCQKNKNFYHFSHCLISGRVKLVLLWAFAVQLHTAHIALINQWFIGCAQLFFVFFFHSKHFGKINGTKCKQSNRNTCSLISQCCACILRYDCAD